MAKMIKVCKECNETFTTINKDRTYCQGCRPSGRGEAKSMGKIKEKYLVRGNISHGNRACSITAGGV